MGMFHRSRIILLGLLVVALTAAGMTYRLYTTRANYLLDKGQAALERGNWSYVDRCLDLLEARGYWDHAHLLRGKLWLSKARLRADPTAGNPPSTFLLQNSFSLALRELAQIKDDGPLTLDGNVLGAECLVHLGERRFAAEVLNTVVKRNPNRKEAHQWLAAIYMDLNSPDQAIAHLREWGRLDPRNGRPYRWIGWFLWKDYAKLTEAIEAYREARRRDLEPSLRAEVAKEEATLLIDGPADYEAALEALAQSPESADQPEFLTLRAQCLWNLARQAEAVPMVERALRANPELPAALQLRAKICLADGQPRAALPLLEKALRVDPHDHLSRQLIMQAYRQAGDDARAEQERKVLEETRGYKDRLTRLHDEALRRPWDAKVRHQLADLCQKLNLQAEAQMWRQAALACTPNQSSEPTLEGSVVLPERN